MTNRARFSGVRTKGAALVVPLVLLAILAGCAQEAADPEPSPASPTGADGADGTTDPGDETPFKVVSVSTASGPVAAINGATANGLRAFVDAFNAEGGIDGKLIDLVVLDDQSDPTIGQAQLRRAIEQEPIALGWAGLTAPVLSSVELLDTSGIAVVQQTGLDALLYPTPKDWFFNAGSPSGRQHGVAMIGQAEQLLGDLEGTRVAIIAAEAASLDVYVEEWERLAPENGSEVVAVERVPFETTSFDTQAAAFARLDLDYILMAVVGGSNVTVVKALETAGVDVPMMASIAGNEPAVLEGVANPNYYALRHYVLPTDNKALMASAEAAGVTPDNSVFWSDGWAIGKVIADTLEACGVDCDAQGFKETLAATQAIELPEGVTPSPLDYSNGRRSGITSVRFAHWTGSGEEYTDPVQVGD